MEQLAMNVSKTLLAKAPMVGLAAATVVYVGAKPGSIFMKVLLIAAFAVLTAPAYAQTPNVNLIPELQSKTPEEKEAEAVREKAYKDSLRKIPDAKTPSDPWGAVRNVETPKAASPKAGAKSGSTQTKVEGR
jgi:hypothetical protein